MAGSGPGYELEMTVTWGDCDAAGISYYAKNFDWFTNGRFGLLAACGFPYMDAFHHQGISLICLAADCRYRKMLRPEDKITLHTSLTTLTRTRMAFTYRIFKTDGELAAEGTTSHTYVDGEGLPFNLEKRFPQLWRQLAGQFDAAEGRDKLSAAGLTEAAGTLEGPPAAANTKAGHPAGADKAEGSLAAKGMAEGLPAAAGTAGAPTAPAGSIQAPTNGGER